MVKTNASVPTNGAVTVTLEGKISITNKSEYLHPWNLHHSSHMHGFLFVVSITSIKKRSLSDNRNPIRPTVRTFTVKGVCR